MFVLQSSASEGPSYLFSDSSQAGWYRNTVNRPLELFLVLLASPVVIPLLLMLALLVMLDGGKPFYSQLRVSRRGRSYRLWKLRSMVVDADDRLEACLVANSEARAEWDQAQKLRDDPRITRVGRLLRACSLVRAFQSG